MRIAVNTRLLLPGRLDGMGWFCYESMKRITLQHPEHEFIFIFDRKFADEFIFADNITPMIVRPVTRHPFLWYLWLDWSLPRKLKKWKVDLFVSPDGFIPLKGKIPAIPVIHDINFLHRPDDVPFWARTYYNFFFPRFAKRAVRVATVSEYSRRDISESYSIPENKISVVYNGVNEVYKPISGERINKTRLKFSGGAPYFVFVGTLHPRKNVVNLLKAFDDFCGRTEQNIKLLIVGEKMFLTREIDEALKNMVYRKEVIFTGRLDPDDLHNVVASALAMSFVPFFEGFGIPVIEAMKCEVPVIASKVTSLPEVGQDAVLYCDPADIHSISEAMISISTDSELRMELIEKGKNRVKDFSWDLTAGKLWKLIESVLYES